MRVKDLLIACEQQVLNGNGDKQIYISSDDEWNDWHKLLFLFTSDIHGNVDMERICDIEKDDEINNIILLG